MLNKSFPVLMTGFSSVMAIARFSRLIPTIIFTLVLMQVLMFGIVRQTVAVPVFTFDINDEGWTNQATEDFSVEFALGEGFGGGGALAISALWPRDSYQIVHAENPDWPTTLSFFQQITFDVRLEPDVEILSSTTGMQIRDNIGNESNVYLTSNIIDLCGGWTRVFMEPTDLFYLPLSHRDVGLNLHVGTTSWFADSLVMVIDNIEGGVAPVPEPATMILLGTGLVGLAGVGRKKSFKK